MRRLLERKCERWSFRLFAGLSRAVTRPVAKAAAAFTVWPRGPACCILFLCLSHCSSCLFPGREMFYWHANNATMIYLFIFSISQQI